MSRLDARSRLRIGDRVWFRGAERAVIGLAGTTVRLAGPDGALMEATVAELASAPDFERVGVRVPGPLPSASPLDGLPEAAVAEALWWERHIVEVLRGLPPDALPGTVPRPEYDPGLVSLTRREQASSPPGWARRTSVRCLTGRPAMARQCRTPPSRRARRRLQPAVAVSQSS